MLKLLEVAAIVGRQSHSSFDREFLHQVLKGVRALLVKQHEANTAEAMEVLNAARWWWAAFLALYQWGLARQNFGPAQLPARQPLPAV